jgi:hypothetical protein
LSDCTISGATVVSYAGPDFNYFLFTASSTATSTTMTCTVKANQKGTASSSSFDIFFITSSSGNLFDKKASIVTDWAVTLPVAPFQLSYPTQEVFTNQEIAQGTIVKL